MGKPKFKTRSARYFLDLNKRANFRDAAEVAAAKERDPMLTGFQDLCQIPVDVERIARRKGIRFGADLSEKDHKTALLIPLKKGFILRLHPNQTHLRKRYTIAHEIGHTLFYRNMEHQIGLLDKMELETEEKICDMFAGALLMPPAHILRSLSRISNEKPWEIFAFLEHISRKFQVSIPAIISRIQNVGGSFTFPCVLLYFRYMDNKVTKKDKQLRIKACASLGGLANTITWSNRSARGINHHSAENLFIEWRKQLEGSREPTGGRYTLSSEGKIKRSTNESLQWLPEKINFSIKNNGKWTKKVITALASNCLYVRAGGDENEAYVISIIKLVNRTGGHPIVLLSTKK